MTDKTPVTAPERKESRLPVDPFTAMRREIDCLFDDMWRPWGGFGTLHVPSLRGIAADVGAAKVDVSETGEAYEMTAELPGLGEKDVEVTFSEGVLTIKCEHEEEKEEEDEEKRYHLRERRFGSVERSLGFGDAVDDGKITAEFKDGLLAVHLPKTERKKKEVRRIEVKA